MQPVEIVSIVVTILSLLSFCAVFTILFRHYYKNNINDINTGKDDIYLIDNAIDEEKEKKNKTKKALKLTGRIASYLILGTISVFFLFSLISRFSGNTMMIGNNSIIVIASGSMSKVHDDNLSYIEANNLTNQFNQYDIIGVTKYNSQDDVKLYDVVAYKSDQGETIIHRIVEFKIVDGETQYITKGDANKNSDENSLYKGYLKYENIIGYYNNFRIETLGIFVIFLQSNAGMITIVSIVYCLLMFDYFNMKYDKALVNRTNFLVNLLEYDLQKERQEGDISSNYKETLIYKGYKYTFENGEFLEKVEFEEDKENKITEENMVVVKENNDINSVQIKNTKTNVTKSINNLSKEDLKEPTKFIDDSKKRY